MPATPAAARGRATPHTLHYSQGGIYGTTYMGITNDVERGVVGVAGAHHFFCLACVGPTALVHGPAATLTNPPSSPLLLPTSLHMLLQGMPYCLLLPRSLDFATPFIGLKVRYENPADRILLLTGMQLLWNRIDPVGALPAVRRPLPPPPCFWCKSSCLRPRHLSPKAGSSTFQRTPCPTPP